MRLLGCLQLCKGVSVSHSRWTRWSRHWIGSSSLCCFRLGRLYPLLQLIHLPGGTVCFVAKGLDLMIVPHCFRGGSFAAGLETLNLCVVVVALAFRKCTLILFLGCTSCCRVLTKSLPLCLDVAFCCP